MVRRTVPYGFALRQDGTEGIARHRGWYEATKCSLYAPYLVIISVSAMDFWPHYSAVPSGGISTGHGVPSGEDSKARSTVRWCMSRIVAPMDRSAFRFPIAIKHCAVTDLVKNAPVSFARNPSPHCFKRQTVKVRKMKIMPSSFLAKSTPSLKQKRNS